MLIEWGLGGLLAVGFVIYLGYALARPERF